MSYFEKVYGIPEMSLEEEMNLSVSMKLTERSKIEMVNKCGLMRQAIDQIEYRARKIPMEDDASHANLVNQLAALVKEAEKLLWQAATYVVS